MTTAHDLTRPEGLRPVRLTDMPGGRDRYIDSVAQEGVRLADMNPSQRGAVKGWLENQAGHAWWMAQGAAHRGDELGARRHLSVHDQMLAKAAELEAGL